MLALCRVNLSKERLREEPEPDVARNARRASSTPLRHRLRRDKDESVELEFNFLIPDPDSLFSGNTPFIVRTLTIQHAAVG